MVHDQPTFTVPGELIYTTPGTEIDYQFGIDKTGQVRNRGELVKLSNGDLAHLRSIIGPLLLDVENSMAARGMFDRFTDPNYTSS